MTDPPPKKIGSLRDRIAAFENKGAAPAPAPAPVPRPKPGHVAWTPKPVPASPPARRDANVADDGDGRRTGMSAADAQESIGKLSLKERMAALQGSTAFGGPTAAAPPPRPTSEKPKWKPPPVVQRVEPIDGEDEEEKPDPVIPNQTGESEQNQEGIATSPAVAEEHKEAEVEGEAKDEGEPDVEEEERQRRAALTARMARLGGARVGMAPPIFGKKPDVPPKRGSISKGEDKPKEEDIPMKDDKPKEIVVTEETPAGSSPSTEVAQESPTTQKAVVTELPPSAGSNTESGSEDYFAAPAKQGSLSSATLSPESAASPRVRSPAMPIPLGPKRAAPPRKRAAKSPSPAARVAQDLQESPSPLPAEREAHDSAKAEEIGTAEPTKVIVHSPVHDPEVTESQVEKVVEDSTSKVTKEEDDKDAAVHDAAAPEISHDDRIDQSDSITVEEHPSHDHAPDPVAPEEHSSHDNAPAIPAEEAHSEEPIAEAGSHAEKYAVESEEPALIEEPEEEEEDEAARRKRIAERIAKSGGVNPFAGGMPPPVLRKDSADSVRSPSALPTRRDSRQESDLKESKPELPGRRESVDLSSDGGVTEEPQAFEQSKVAHDLHHYSIEEGYEDENEEPRGRRAARASYDRESANSANEYEHSNYEDQWSARETDDEPETNQFHVEDEPRARHLPPSLTPRPPPAIPHTETREFEDAPPTPSLKPPPPPLTPRPPPAVPHVGIRETDEEEDNAVSPPPPPRRVYPPPPQRAAARHSPPPQDEVAEDLTAHQYEENAYARHAREVGPQHEEEDERSLYEEEEEEQREYEYFGEQKEVAEQDDEAFDTEDQYVSQPPPPRHAAVPPRVPPPPPVSVSDEDEEEPAPPPPPRRISLNAPPPPPRPRPAPQIEQENEGVQLTEEPEESVEEEELAPPPPPPRQSRRISQPPVVPPQRGSSKPILPRLSGPSLEQEVLDDSDVDPIDPEFYSPQKSAGSGSQPTPSPQHTSLPPLASSPQPPSFIPPPPPPPPPPPQRTFSSPPPRRVTSPPPQRVVSPSSPPEQTVSSGSPPSPSVSARSPVALPVPEQQESRDEGEESADAEQARRRTIAERMAKLGGLRFGAPPPVPALRRAPPPPEPESEQEAGHPQEPSEGEDAPPEEEDEFARKQRIAARIAGMGGMRFGMLPGAVAPPAPPRVQYEEGEEESSGAQLPPKRSAPVPPPPHPPAYDEYEESDYQHVSDSDHVGHDESELEEVTYTDAEAEQEEAPPVPDRHARRASTGPPPVPHTPSFASPPPVPRTRPPSAFTYPPPPPRAPPTPATREAQGGEFILVDQPESVDEPPPPPPPRAARAPPRAPPIAPNNRESRTTIPSIDFGGETDLSLSAQWSEDSTNYPPPHVGKSPAAVEAPQPPAPAPPAEQNLTAEDLQSLWGRVGVQVHEIAAALFEKSKKGVVGDGSYRGFVGAVLGQVPTAIQPTESLDSFGYLVYIQSAGAVQRRASDIMPGDVIVVYDAKFKGHKGLQSYSQSVGVGEPLVGVIGDVEVKKSKVKVYQANQHVGQQSVESVSYRLEDMKSGQVKIFRVLEA